MNVKICTKCKKEKSLDEFNKAKRGKYGKSSKCKKCCNEYMTNRYFNQGGKDKVLAYHRNNPDIVKKAINKYQKNFTPGVYRLWTEDGDYIGESIKIERRLWNHKDWNTGSPVNKPILRYEILEVVEDEDLRKERERYYINLYKPVLNGRDYHWTLSK